MSVVVNIVTRFQDRALKRAQAELAAFATKASAAQGSLAGSMIRTGQAMRRGGEAMVGYGRGLTKWVTAPVIALAALSVKAAKDFDEAMTKSLAIMSDVGPGIRKQMELTARSVAKHTTFSATQAAEAYYFLASAGLDAKQSMAALPGVAKFAEAGQFDLAEATEYLADSQAALGLKSKNAAKYLENQTRVSDVLVRANTLANASVQQFAEALTNKAAAGLRMVNKSVEEGTAVLAVFADQGLKGKAAGQGLYMVLRDLQKAAAAQPEAWKELGVSVYDAEGNMRSVGDIIADMEGKFIGLSDKQKRAQLAAMGFTDKGLAPLLMLMGKSDQIQTYQAELEKASGFTERVAHKQLESFTNQVKLMWHRITDVGISLGQFLIPALRELVGHVGKAVDWFGRLDPATQKTIGKFALAAAAVGPVLIVLGKLSIGLGSLLTTAGVFGATFSGAAAKGASGIKAFGMAMNASGLLSFGIVAVIAAVIAAVVLLYMKCEWFRNAVHAVIGAVVAAFRWLADGVRTVIGWISDHWRGLLDAFLLAAGPVGWIVRYIIKHWDKVVEVSRKVWDAVKSAVLRFWNWAGPYITAAVALWWLKIKVTAAKIRVVVGWLWDKVKAGVEWFWGWSEGFITGSLKAWWTVISTTFKLIVDIVTATWDAVYAAVSWFWGWAGPFITASVKAWWTIISTVFDLIVTVVRIAWKVISTVVSTAIKSVVMAVRTVQKVIAFVRGVWNAVRDVTRSVWNAVVGFLGGVGSRILSGLKTLGRIIAYVRDVFGSARQAAIDRLRALISWVAGVGGKIKNAIGNLGRLLYDVGKDVVLGLRDGIVDAWHWVTEKLRSLISGLSSAAKKALGINSPSRVFAAVGKSIGEGMAAGIDASRGLAASAADRMAADTVFSGAGGRVGSGSRSVTIAPGAVQIAFSGAAPTGPTQAEIEATVNRAFRRLAAEIGRR